MSDRAWRHNVLSCFVNLNRFIFRASCTNLVKNYENKPLYQLLQTNYTIIFYNTNIIIPQATSKARPVKTKQEACTMATLKQIINK